jgi:hypothetical protein
MPERLDNVTIKLNRGTATLPWPSRDALLEKLTHVEHGTSIRDAFEAVGASRPVELTLEQKAKLHGVIDNWIDGLEGGVDDLDEGIRELWAGLYADVYGDETGS